MAKTTSTKIRSEAQRLGVCTGCACLCDDISMPNCSPQLASDEVLRESNLCDQGLDWLKSLRPSSKTRLSGKEASLDAAIEKARELIDKSRSPVICGLDGLCTASQQAAWRLADRIRATIDVSLVHAGRGGMNALQRVGRVTSTMGEVAQRSDFVLLWFVDPLSSHPRLWDRVIRSKHDPQRHVVVIDRSETLSAKRSNQFIGMNREQGSLVLSVLRALLIGSKLDQKAVANQTGLDVSLLQGLLDQMVQSNYGAMFSKATQDSEFDSESEVMAKLIRDLNDSTRFVNLSLRNDQNTQSAENVLAWSSGFAASVNLNRSFSRNCFSEYSAQTLLSESACDLIVLASTVGFAEAWSKLDANAQLHLHRTPTIVLNEVGENPCSKVFQPHVEIAVSRPGFTAVGDFCRLDDVLIPLSSIGGAKDCSIEMVSAGEVLDRLAVN